MVMIQDTHGPLPPDRLCFGAVRSGFGAMGRVLGVGVTLESSLGAHGSRMGRRRGGGLTLLRHGSFQGGEEACHPEGAMPRA